MTLMLKRNIFVFAFHNKWLSFYLLFCVSSVITPVEMLKDFMADMLKRYLVIYLHGTIKADLLFDVPDIF